MNLPRRPRLLLVAALDRRGAIGRKGTLLWQERADQQHFRCVTLGYPVIMGRKTWDSLPARFKPLPERRNIVVTRNASWRADGAERAGSLEEALLLAQDAERVAVIGGGELYALALPRADELLLTEVDAAFDGADTYFPNFDRTAFVEAAREPQHAADGTRFDFVRWRRATQ